ncbi:MAG: Sua5/YciO/YrdC/YwlC family protein, partial [Flavobacteriales bacterium]|nr:Sua5/YciO/YrdC/YwlC family protein [Flavobacteriales bacterium]
KEAIDKIGAIKQREPKGYVILVCDLEMLESIVSKVPQEALEIIKNQDKPTTIIYPNYTNLASNCTKSNGSIAIRLVDKGICHDIIKKIGHPIISTSANISGGKSPKTFSEIDQKILSAVDHVVNLPEASQNTSASRIVELLEDGKLRMIRE